VNTNFEGVVRVTEAVLPMMKEQNYGRIVNMTSIMGNVENLSRKIQFVLMHEREKWTTTDQIRKGSYFVGSPYNGYLLTLLLFVVLLFQKI
jgi:NAD(P)-dependent dehydrogenase (short-subunit alcohol dehydrogenase family)